MSPKAKRKKAATRSSATGKRKSTRKQSPRKKCGLCGATKNLTRTDCCGNWICNDEHEYKIFSYARNSCYRNHARYTLCGAHFSEGHDGDWKDCRKCRKMMETEMYVYNGTNEYNFEVLENSPAYEPTHCAKCGAIIILADGGYSYGPGGYKCGECTYAEYPDAFE